MIESDGGPSTIGDGLMPFVVALMKRLAVVEAALANSSAARNAADELRRTAEERYASLQASSFWRITAPLRCAVELMRHGAGFLRSRTLDAAERQHLMAGLAAVPPTSVAETSAIAPTNVQAEAAAYVGMTARVSLDTMKREFRDLCATELAAALTAAAKLTFPQSDNPKVSVIVVVYNQEELTYCCLRNLKENLGECGELIIWDNGSNASTQRMLSLVEGALVLRAEENLHFLRAVNRAAKAARGRYILLLNSDAMVQPGAISAATTRLDQERDLGAVGGPILQLNGQLQEAGSIIWRNGHTEPFGRNDDPNDAAYRYRRDVDYCSGAFLMVRKDLWESLGGFDEIFAPAYYEETDLCMRIRAAGFRVGYEPEARILHFEYGSAVSPDDAASLYGRNHTTFLARHAATLAADHHDPQVGALVAATRPPAWCRVLILDVHLPRQDQGAATAFLLTLARHLKESGCRITYCHLKSFTTKNNNTAILFKDIENLTAKNTSEFEKFFHNRFNFYNFIIVNGGEGVDIPFVLLKNFQSKGTEIIMMGRTRHG